MSQNVDMVRASFAAYDNEDFDALREMMHPDFEQHDWPEAASGGRGQGATFSVRLPLGESAPPASTGSADGDVAAVPLPRDGGHPRGKGRVG
mgnify:CR=1 FL=1